MISKPIVVLALLAAPAMAAAQAAPGPFRIVDIATPADPAAIPLYPAGTLPTSGAREQWNRTIGEIGSMHVDQRSVRNVVQPTITPVLPPRSKATGAAVIVAPGGAFLSLSMDSEGFDVARRLAERGIAAFVLKYRLQDTPADNRAFMATLGQVFGEAGRGDAKGRATPPQSAADARQALKLVRARAGEFGIDPARVGMVGFSAGAQTAMETALGADAATRPAFLGYIYGPMRAVAVPAGAPPMFAALALDDGLFGRQGFGVVEAWQRAGRPVELHAYQAGDHGFGTGRPGTTSTQVLSEFVAWMDANGWLKAAR